jgi:hypothetical protein
MVVVVGVLVLVAGALGLMMGLTRAMSMMM